MGRRATGTALVLVLAAAAAWALATRPSWLPGIGDGGSAGPTASEPPALAGADASDSARSDASASLAARPAVAVSGELPPPADFASVDRDLDLHGTIVDGAGAPVAGADLVTVTYPFERASILAVDHDDDAIEGPRTRSANDGTFVIRLRRGSVVSLRVTAAGFAPIERPSCRAGDRVRIEVRPGVSLLVDARTPEGGPAEKVEFLLKRYRHAGTVAFRRTATTGADGLARFDDLPSGVSAWLGLGAAAWAWPEHQREVTLPVTGETRLTIALARGRTITGRVTDAETGTPIAGARVGMNWVLDHPVTTGADGTYVLPGWTGQGIRDVHALAAGYGRGQTVVGAASVVDFALVKGDTAVGRVIGPDRAPIAGAVVAVVGSARGDREQVISTAGGTTAPDGRFALAGLRRDLPHTLVVMAAGHGRTLVDFDPRTGGPGRIDLGDIALPLGRTLSGRILRHDGTTVSDVQIVLKGANADRGRLREGGKAIEDSWYGSTEEATAAADGRFAFIDLAPGTYGIEAWTPGMTSRHVTVKVPADADPAPVEIRFDPGRTIRITVVDDEGKPVPSAYIFASEGSGPFNQVTRLDAQGTTTLLVTDSLTSIVVHPPDERSEDARRFLPWSPEFPVTPETREIRCVLKRGVALAGRVVGPDGAGVALAGVEVWSRGAFVTSLIADDEGRFEATVSPHDGPYALRLDGSAGGWQALRDAGLTGSVDDVPAGATGVVVKARPVARDHVQVVRVRDPDGRPVEGATVRAFWALEAGKATATTDAAGVATLAGLPDLPCAWRAEPGSGEGDLLPTRGTRTLPSDVPVEIALRRGVRVRGRVVLPPDAAGQSVHIDLMQVSSGRRLTVDPAHPDFSAVIDPEDGEGGTVTARIGPDDTPTHVVRIEIARFGPEEIVLTPAPVK
jgi:protocatechuate 3,4-dioxygenase beta subunit